MASLRAAAGDGIRASLPLLLGIIPFGVVAGVAAVDAGLSPVAALGMSVVIFAGAAQLAVIELFRTDTPLAVVVLTGVVVNLRMLMYSASLAPYFEQYRTRWKAILAYFLTDQAYALAIARYTDSERDGDGTDESETAAATESDGGMAENGARDWYYLGVAVTLWAVWVTSTVVGIGLGRGLPSSWGLEFAVPLVFLALLVPRLTDRPTLAAAVAAGLVALVGRGLPFELGLPVAAIVGVLVGVGLEGRGRRESR